MSKIPMDMNVICDSNGNIGNIRKIPALSNQSHYMQHILSFVTGWRLSTTASVRSEYEYGGIW
jgi:hypothetical protein